MIFQRRILVTIARTGGWKLECSLQSRTATSRSSPARDVTANCTEALAPFHSFQKAGGDDHEDVGLNPGLESVMNQGAATLERTAADVQAKTKKVKTLVSAEEQSQKKEKPQQLAERQRLLDVATECLEAICDRNPNNPLAVGGEPLVLVDVQVNSTSKQAKVFWTLPYSILMDERL
eukprot:CAMPEP_0176170188 /NCGR_PEP_ID=MMETSP0120_2-20121206/87132_1 /TAXON_ID=160619 /ORGANISM="Kryptoperidinium foliaceum, Strain CCMP 1326" /LENGTH=176 /DNA_ID=CAMNT_0017507997 /DNA_START=1 /DNA_END=528 /DNA_ORIENTATION=-